MILIWIVVFLSLSSAMPTGYRDDFQNTVPCRYVRDCSRNGQLWNIISRGQNKHSDSPINRAMSFNQNSYLGSTLPLGLVDFIATGFQALFSDILGSRYLQSPVYHHRQSYPPPKYELLVMKDNNVYIMPVTLQNVNYGEEVSIFGTRAKNDVSGGMMNINIQNATVTVVPANLQLNYTEENAITDAPKAKFEKDTRYDQSVADEIFPESEGPLIVQQTGIDKSTDFESGKSDISLPENDSLEFINGLTSTKGESVLVEVSPEETEIVFVDLTQLKEPESSVKEQVGYVLAGSDNVQSEINVPSRKQENNKWLATALNELRTEAPESLHTAFRY